MEPRSQGGGDLPVSVKHSKQPIELVMTTGPDTSGDREVSAPLAARFVLALAETHGAPVYVHGRGGLDRRLLARKIQAVRRRIVHVLAQMLLQFAK